MTRRTAKNLTTAADLAALTPPHNLEAERSLLGTLLRENQAIIDVEPILPAGQAEELFYWQDHAELYRLIIELNAARRAVDYIALGEAIAAKFDEGQRVRLIQMIGQVDGEATLSVHAVHHARIVAHKAEQRWCLALGRDIIRESINPSEPGGLPEFIEKRVLELSAKRCGNDDIAPLTYEAGQILDRIGQPQAEVQIGYLAGLAPVDSIFAFEPGTVTTIGARTSVGKSMIMGQFALNMAMQGLPTLLISLEMRRLELAERMMACWGEIRHRALRTGQLSEDEAIRASEAYTALATHLFQVSTTPGQTLGAIASKARRHKLRHGLKVLAIDYLQLIEGERIRGESRAEEVGRISKGLKRLALELDIVVITASQLNRDAANGKPQLAALRESGSIEQDSDAVILLWQEDGDRDPDRVHGQVAKQRNGKVAEFEMFRNAAYMRFQPYFLHAIDGGHLK
jgi:replicative DNA helicase